MYMVDGYGENNPIVVKSQFIMSLVERIDPKGVGAKQKSIIDRCTGIIYAEAEQNGTIPTLATLREKLLEQPEAEAREICRRYCRDRDIDILDLPNDEKRCMIKDGT